MTLYELLKTIHVLGAITWVGTAILSQIQGTRVAATGDKGKLAAYVDEQEWLGTHVYPQASIAVIITGVWMVIISGWNFSELWIIFGIAIFAISVLTGILYFNPETPKLKAALVEGRDDAEFRSRVDRITLVTRIDLVLLILVVANMVIKPGT